MKIVFEGLNSEYEIEKSCFCINAFVVKDKIKNRDGVDFITSNVKFLEFKDDCFTFDDILNHLNIYNDEDIIVVEDFCLDSKKQENKEKLQNILPIVEVSFYKIIQIAF